MIPDLTVGFLHPGFEEMKIPIGCVHRLRFQSYYIIKINIYELIIYHFAFLPFTFGLAFAFG